MGIQIFCSSESDLVSLINSAIAKAFKEHQQQQKPDNTLITQQEAAQLLKVSIPTLQKMKNQKVISFVQIQRKIYFKKQDILNEIQAFASKANKG